MLPLPPRLFLVAGEMSGDVLGGRLMQAIQRLTGGNVAFDGVGGPAMQAAGLKSRFDMGELSLMGVCEVIPRLPKLLQRQREMVSILRCDPPAALVTIDAPAFGLRLSRRVKGLPMPRLHYVAPQVWAWLPKRARRVADSTDCLMTLLPFEPPYFTTFGLEAHFVGHPVVESGAGSGDGVSFRIRHGMDRNAPMLVVLLGSRISEVQRLGDIFGAALWNIVKTLPSLRVVVPTVISVFERVQSIVKSWPADALILRDEREKFAAFAAADAALAASGTVTLELGLSGCPMVVAYRLNMFSAALARLFLTVEWVSLVNILLGRRLIPEMLQDECAPDKLADTVLTLLTDEKARIKQREGFIELANIIESAGALPSERAARIVLSKARLPIRNASIV